MTNPLSSQASIFSCPESSFLTVSAHVSRLDYVSRPGHWALVTYIPIQYLYGMPVRKEIPYQEGLFFITFTCFKWLPLIDLTNSYDLVYSWFDYLEKQNHRVAGYVIMPNHLHVLIDFSATVKKINAIIGDGKRFMAYAIIQRLQQAGKTDVLMTLEKAVATKRKEKGKLHEVWEESFDWKICETAEFTYQKLIYIHNNPCSGKWNLVEDITKYEHNSARYYITGKHAGYMVTDVEVLLSGRYAADELSERKETNG